MTHKKKLLNDELGNAKLEASIAAPAAGSGASSSSSSSSSHSTCSTCSSASTYSSGREAPISNLTSSSPNSSSSSSSSSREEAAAATSHFKALLEGLENVAVERKRRSRKVDSQDLLLHFMHYISTTAMEEMQQRGQQEKQASTELSALEGAQWHEDAWVALLQKVLALPAAAPTATAAEAAATATAAEDAAGQASADTTSAQGQHQEQQQEQQQERQKQREKEQDWQKQQEQHETRVSEVGVMFAAQQQQLYLSLLLLKEPQWIEIALAALEDVCSLVPEEGEALAAAVAADAAAAAAQQQLELGQLPAAAEAAANALRERYFRDVFNIKNAAFFASAPLNVYKDRKKERRLWRAVAALHLLVSIATSEFAAAAAAAVCSSRKVLRAAAPLLVISCSKGGLLAVAVLRALMQAVSAAPAAAPFVAAAPAENTADNTADDTPAAAATAAATRPTILTTYPQCTVSLLHLCLQEQATDPRGVNGLSLFSVTPALPLALQLPELREIILNSEVHKPILQHYLTVMLKAFADRQFCLHACNNTQLARDIAEVLVELGRDQTGVGAMQSNRTEWFLLWRECKNLWTPNWNKGEQMAWDVLGDTLIRRGQLAPSTIIAQACVWGTKANEGGCAHCMRSDNTSRFLRLFNSHHAESAADDAAAEHQQQQLGPWEQEQQQMVLQQQQLLHQEAEHIRREKTARFRQVLEQRRQQRQQQLLQQDQQDQKQEQLLLQLLQHSAPPRLSLIFGGFVVCSWLQRALLCPLQGPVYGPPLLVEMRECVLRMQMEQKKSVQQHQQANQQGSRRRKQKQRKGSQEEAAALTEEATPQAAETTTSTEADTNSTSSRSGSNTKVRNSCSSNTTEPFCDVDLFTSSFKKDTKTFSRIPCPVCHAVSYCSEECRESDKPFHMLLCTPNCLSVLQ